MSGEGTWSCHACTLENPPNRKRCNACQTRREVDFRTNNYSSTSNVRSWLTQRRRKRKRPSAPSESNHLVHVRILLKNQNNDDDYYWQGPPLQALLVSQTGQRPATTIAVPTLDKTQSQSIPPPEVNLNEPIGLQTHQHDVTKGNECETAPEAVVGGSTHGTQGGQLTAKVVGDIVAGAHDGNTNMTSVSVMEVTKQQTNECDYGLEKADSRPGNAVAATEPKGVRQTFKGETMIAKPDGVLVEKANVGTNESAQSESPVNDRSDSLDFGVERKGDADCQVLVGREDENFCYDGNKDYADNVGDDSRLESYVPPVEKYASEAMLCRQEVGGDNHSKTSVQNPSFGPSNSKRSEEEKDFAIARHQRHCRNDQDGLVLVDDYGSIVSSQDETAECGFSQLMTQQPCGFLYSQMSQSERDCESGDRPQFDPGHALTNETHSLPLEMKGESKERTATYNHASSQNTEALPHESMPYALETLKAARPRLRQEPNEEQGPELSRAADGRANSTPVAKEPPSPSCKRMGAMFQTAGRRTVISVSEDSMARASSLLQSATFAPSDDAWKVEESSLPKPSDGSQYPATFQTAGRGAVISVTEDSVARASSLLVESALSSDSNAKESSQPESPVPIGGPQFSATFQTAGKGKAISVSEDGIARASSLLDTESLTAGDTSRDRRSSIPKPRRDGPPFAAMFQTAGKRNVISVSEDSMARASSLLDTESLTAHDASKDKGSSLPRSRTDGSRFAAMFQTAGKRNVISVSDDSMARASALLGHASASGSEEQKSSPPTQSVRGDANPFAPMFQTAGKRNVISVSEDSMTRASSLLGNVSTSGSEEQKSSPPKQSVRSDANPFAPMFQTAGKRNVISVSEDSMTRASSLLSSTRSSLNADVGYKEKESSTSAVSARNVESQCAPAVRTAGTVATIAVYEHSLANAGAVLEISAGTKVMFHAKNAQVSFPSSSTEKTVLSVPDTSEAPAVASPQVTSRTRGGTKYKHLSSPSSAEKTTLSVPETSVAAAMASPQVTSSTRSGANEPTSGLQTYSYDRPTALFRTAGTENVVSATADAIANAATILRGTKFPCGDTVKKFPPVDSSVRPARHVLAGSFHAGGEMTGISTSEDNCVREEKAMQDAERLQSADSTTCLSSFHTADTSNRFELCEQVSSEAESTTSDSIPKTFPLFQTAGKGTMLSVSSDSLERAGALLREQTAACASDNKISSRVDNCSVQTKRPPPDPIFRTAGRRSAPSVPEESMKRAEAMFQAAPSHEPTTANPEQSSRDNKATPVSREHGHSGSDSHGESLYAGSTVSKPRSSLPLFQTAGKGSTIRITADGMAKANALLVEGKAEGKQPDSASTNECHVNALPTFQTADKGSLISVSEEHFAQVESKVGDEVVEQEGSAFQTFEGVSIAAALSTAGVENISSGTKIPTLQTAGKSSTIAVTDDSLARAAMILEKGTATTSDSILNKAVVEQNTFETVSTDCCGQISLFERAGSGNTISVSDQSVAHASALLRSQSSTDNAELGKAGPTRAVDSARTDEITTAVENRTDADGISLCATGGRSMRANELLSKPEKRNEHRIQSSVPVMQPCPKKTRMCDIGENAKHPVHFVGCSADAGNVRSAPRKNVDATPIATCSQIDCHGSQRSQSESGIGTVRNIGDFADSGIQPLSTQPQLPETPFLVNRHDKPKPRKEDQRMRIRSVAFGHTPQSQPMNRSGIPNQLRHHHDVSSTHVHGPMNHAFPAVTPSSSVRDTLMQKPTESTHKLPAFTPKQTPMETETAVVTMSLDPKNPYLRKRNCSPGNKLNGKDAFSPVPIDFRHVENNNRGEVLSPSSLSYPHNALMVEPLNEISNTHFHAATDEATGSLSTPTASRGKKVVRWSDDKRNGGCMLPVRSTLSDFASSYGRMEDCFDAGRDAGVHNITLGVNSTNATRVRFDPQSGMPCSFFGQPCPPSRTPVGGVKDLRESLIRRGCDDKALTDKWISNHFRWIVWKLASTERRFACTLAQSYLTYEHVIAQLRHRYDTELKGGRRSALRKVLNRDVAPNSMMILCVSQISRTKKNSLAMSEKDAVKHGECSLELTDGWYAVGCILDSSLCAFLDSGKIEVGSKLLICNAKLEGADEGIDPLDSSYSSFGRNCSAALSLIANGTRLARWDAKMGFVRPTERTLSNRGLLLVRSISDIIPRGGSIPLIDLVVCRLYPRMFLERRGTSNPADMLEKLVGKSPIISEMQEYKNRMSFEKKRQHAIERLSETVQSECAKEVDETAPDLWNSLMKSSSPGDFYERLSGREQTAIDKWKEKRDMLLNDMMQKEIEARLEEDTALFRESTPFVRAYVKSLNTTKTHGDADEETSCKGAMLTIWNPTEQHLGFIREGNVVRIQNLSVRGSKHEGLLQLTAGAKTQMEPAPSSPLSQKQLSSIGYSKRVYAKLFRAHMVAKRLSANSLPSSPAPEIDTAGIILRVDHEGSGMEERESIYLTDETALVLRVDRDRSPDEEDTFSSLWPSARQNIRSPRPVAFRDLRITHFDSSESCAVAVYAQTSSVVTKGAIFRFSSLIQWSETPLGHALLSRVASCMDAGVLFKRPTSTNTSTICGYIAGFTIPDTPGTNHSYLEIKVDCGTGELRVLDFPFFLLDEALQLCSVAPEPVSLDQEQDEKYAKLKVLGKIFSARGLLLVFSLRRKGSNMAEFTDEEERYEVRKVRVANPRTLSDLYVSTLKEAELERKRRLEKSK